jgi:mannose-6-phosphate isomerase-like protein (cupin superfamily)
MKHKHVEFGHGFRVIVGNKHAQAAQMTLAPGETEGGPENRHGGADQWLIVIAGKGEAIVNRKKYPLTPGTVVLIERGDLHEIRNVGKKPLRTLNLYVPPAYSSDGEELPAASRK